MGTFGREDLRLTSEEATGIVKLQRKGNPPSGLVRDLFVRTDGWAAGLVLLLERTDREPMEPRAIGRQVPAEIIDYFGSEIFRGLDEERRGFSSANCVPAQDDGVDGGEVDGGRARRLDPV